jgi:hypothetical protein
MLVNHLLCKKSPLQILTNKVVLTRKLFTYKHMDFQNIMDLCLNKLGVMVEELDAIGALIQK